MSDGALGGVLLVGALGAVIGSFLNVVIYRLPHDDLSVFRPRRSFCPACHRSIPWRENIPILSWLLLRARCAGCQAAIPARYVVVEATTALLFGAWAWHVFQQGPLGGEEAAALGAGLLLIAVCVVVTCIDLEHKIIPDEITWPGMALGLIVCAAAPRLQAESFLYLKLRDFDLERHLAGAVSSAAGVATGILVVLLVGWLGSLAFRKEAMGLGDVKFMGMVGALLGFDGVLLVFFLGCLTGAVGGLLQRLITGDRYIAFGPYLSLGTLLVLYLRGPIVDFILVGWPSTVQSWLH